MDSMVGYKNDKYFYLGRAAAKLDDLLNFIPARLCAWVMIFASYLPSKDHEFDGSHAKEIFLRDRFNNASPNSARRNRSAPDHSGSALREMPGISENL